MATPEAEKETYVSKIALTKNQAKLKDLQKELDFYKKHVKDKGLDAPSDAEVESYKKLN